MLKFIFWFDIPKGLKMKMLRCRSPRHPDVVVVDQDGEPVRYPRHPKVFASTGVPLAYIVHANTETGECCAAVPMGMIPAYLETVERLDPEYRVACGDLGVEIVHFRNPGVTVRVD